MELRLVVGGTENIPTNYYDSSEVPRIYKDAMDYHWKYNSGTMAPQFDVNSFQSNFGFYYFNLAQLGDFVRESKVSLDLRWNLTAGLNGGNYRLYACVLYEGKAMINVKENRSCLTVQ